MKIYSLTGVSGTGKSYQAPSFMAEKGIDALIDDGLLIYKDGVEAGVSAKRQKTKIGAVKTALFTDDEMARSVKEKLSELDPEALLIIGTSDKMVDRIVERLELHPVDERVYIEDITTYSERASAERSREREGKHVIPVPTLQLKRDFAGYFMNPENLMRKAKDVTGLAQEAIKHPSMLLHRPKSGENAKTVVRPTYSYLGDFLIHDKVIKDIAGCVGAEIRGIHRVVSVFENTEPDNLKIIVVVDLEGEAKIWEVAEAFQKRLTEVVEDMTAFNVVSTDIEVRRLV